MTKINTDNGDSELPSVRLNQQAVERVRRRMREEGWPTTDEAVERLLTRVAAISPTAREWATTEGAAASVKRILEQEP